MITRIVKRDNPFVMIDKRPLEDDRLSWRSKGILVYLLSKPNNWTIRTEDILNHGSEGRDAVRVAMGELRTFGYAKIEQTRNGKEWHVFEIPWDDKPCPEKPSMGPCPEKAMLGKSATSKNKGNNNNKTLFPIPEKTRKSKEGTVNGVKPTQAAIEDFCVSLKLTRLDGELMLLKWQADGWPKNWMDKIRYWNRGGYMPSQKRKQGDRAPAKVEVDPPGWAEYVLTLEPFFQERARGRTFHQCPEDMQITFRRLRKAQKEAQNHGTH